MTEFTMMGNLQSINKEESEFYIREGKNIFTIHVTGDSNLLEELETIKENSRLKITGIIIKDSDKNNIFVCRKATMLLGEVDSSIQFVGNKR